MIKIQTETFINGVAKESFRECNENFNSEDRNLDTSSWSLISRGTFKVVKGRKYRGQDPVLTFTTDPQGNFLFSLEPGVYSIVEYERPEKYSRKKNKNGYLWDTKNLKTKWSKSILTFSVKISDTIPMELELYRYSSPEN